MGCAVSSSIDDKSIGILPVRSTRSPHKDPQVKGQPIEINQFQYKTINPNMNNMNSSFLGYSIHDLIKNKKQYQSRNNIDQSYEYLQDLYNSCQGDLQTFFSSLQQKISQIYMSISKSTLDQMNQDILINNESKIQISQEILWFNLNILKLINRKSHYQFNQTIFKQINKLQKNLVGYLKMKYPRAGQNFVPGDLMSVFKQFDLTQDLQFDLLKNSGTYFGSDKQQNICKDIKKFINKLIDELDVHYPKFQKLMQQQVFLVQGQDKQKRLLNYKIGRKVPQNVTKYSDMQSNTLQINSPQIFRVLIKWMQYLQQILLNPNQKINRHKNFKCFIQQDQHGNKIFDQINQDEYYDMINYELIEKIEKQKLQYKQSNQTLLMDLDRFNSHLLKLLDISQRKQKFVSVKQMQTIKYSNLNAKFISWMLAQKLILALQKLVSIGKSFYHTQNMLNLDLIQFKVSDMMRGMVSGSKKQILAVYNNLKKLQKGGKIKIIKIKNRLATSLNDAMIIFLLKGCFLICQLQLILSDGAHKVNQKYKNVETLNHFFYQLQRSPYGILSQIAVFLAYKDSKVSYEDSITFDINNIDMTYCNSSHPHKIVQIKNQKKPFICTKCTKFYFKLENLFMMNFCEICNIFICGKCIFANNQILEDSVINKQINIEIQCSVAQTMTKLRYLSSSSGATSILKVFNSPFKKLSHIFGGNKVQIGKLVQFLDNQFKDINFQQKRNGNVNFVIVNFKKGYAAFKCLRYKLVWKQIQNPFNNREVFNNKQFLSYTNYDLILFFADNLTRVSQKSVTENMLHLFITEYQLMVKIYKNVSCTVTCIKIGDFSLAIDFEKNRKIQSQVHLQQKKYIRQKKQQIAKVFKYQSIHEVTSSLPDLAGAKSILKLNQMGIQSRHLQFFKQINWATSIKQLKLSKNNISSIELILNSCTNLERLYMNQNRISQIHFTKQLAFIQILNFNTNQIQLIDGLNNISSVHKLLLQKNNIVSFPKCDFINIKILNLKSNPIHDYNPIMQSNFPNIQQLYIDYDELYQNTDKMPIVNALFSFPKLRCITYESPSSTIKICSTKIQRLTVQRNGLLNLQLSSFQNLKYLSLRQNLIKDIQFLFSVKNGYENNVITEIDLCLNQLRQFPIIKSTSLIKFKSISNAIESIKNLEQSSIPSLEQLDLSSNQISIICQLSLPKLTNLNLSTNKIQDASGLTKSKLNSLKILYLSSYMQLPKFPLLQLVQLEELHVTSMNIEEMDNLSKSILPKLTLLDLSYCVIISFPKIQFPLLQKLKLVDCKIQFLTNIQKSKLPNLELLDLSNIKLNDDSFQALPDEIKFKKINQKTVFCCYFNFPKLKQLFLESSTIKNLQGLKSSTLPSLQKLSISYCIMYKQPQLTLKSLKTFQAKNCEITDIQSILNSNQLKIQNLQLCGNRITQINISIKSLKNINLQQNQITSFTHDVDLNELQQLNLAYNLLKKFPKIRAPKINKLSIQGNSFDQISQLANCLLDNLEDLRLYGCQFALIQFPVLKMKSLKSLYVQSSTLKLVSNLSLCQLPILEDLNFSGNAIQLMPLIKLPQLKFLRFNQNSILSIQNLTQSVLPQLKIIELEDNKGIQKLPYLPFPNLTHIYMHNNDCKDVSGFNKSPILNFQILNICESKNLMQFPMLQCKFAQIYANRTQLKDVLKLNQFKNLVKIQFNGTGISHIPKLNQPLLQMIQFQDNQLTDINEFAQGDYPNVTEFTIKGNKVKKLPILNMISLQRLYISQNEIQDAQQLIKSNFPKIEMITFQVNKLRVISSLPYSTLSELYISNNPNFQAIQFFTEVQYPNLKMIVAVNTSIKKIQKFPKMKSLQKFWVNNSKVQNLNWLYESSANLPKMYFFSASANLIKVLPSFKNLKITNLYLDQNPIKQISEFLADGQAVLSTIYPCIISVDTQTDEEFEQIIIKVREKGGLQTNVFRYTKQEPLPTITFQQQSVILQQNIEQKQESKLQPSQRSQQQQQDNEQKDQQ